MRVYSIDTAVAGAAALAIAMLAVTTAIHYEALRLLTRAATGHRATHQRVVLLLAALVAAHLAEIAHYAATEQYQGVEPASHRCVAVVATLSDVRQRNSIKLDSSPWHRHT